MYLKDEEALWIRKASKQTGLSQSQVIQLSIGMLMKALGPFVEPPIIKKANDILRITPMPPHPVEQNNEDIVVRKYRGNLKVAKELIEIERR